jgi:ribonuclease HII
MTPRQKFDLSLLPNRPDLQFENQLWSGGYKFVAGVDEAGRGALAGPVAAGAVVLPALEPNLYDCLVGVRDSKKMSAEDRDHWAAVIKEKAVTWAVGFASNLEIDRIGIVPATCLAASRALAKLSCLVEHVLVDYLTLPNNEFSQTPLIKGDARSLSIASAAILAKTARDAVLSKLDGEFPGYHFASNKGYATQAHRQAIQNLGPCDQHRFSFSPVKQYGSLFPPDKDNKK